MIETFTSDKAQLVTDCDGIYFKTHPYAAKAAEIAHKITNKNARGAVLFDRTSARLYKSQPVVPGSALGTKLILELLSVSGRTKGHSILSNRPPLHKDLTHEDLIAMGVDPDEVMCVGFGASLKHGELERFLQEGKDVVWLENDRKAALGALELNDKSRDTRVCTYLFDDHSGQRDYPGIVRVTSFENVFFDLCNKLPALPRGR